MYIAVYRLVVSKAVLLVVCACLSYRFVLVIRLYVSVCVSVYAFVYAGLYALATYVCYGFMSS